MNYKVEITQSGRGGTIYYIEDDHRMSFDWEFSMSGATIFVRTPDEWEKNSQSQDASWTSGRRQEILERLAEDVRRQQAPSARIEIEDHWIELTF
jgi:hypothetical protein